MNLFYKSLSVSYSLSIKTEDVLRYLIVLISLLLIACTSPNGSKVSTTKYGDFAYEIKGVSKPTIVFESGLADDMNVWQQVIEQISSQHETFAYNRAGFSGSHSINSTRNGAVIVEELNALLERNKLTPPYILVGHSLGAGYLELYAKTYPYNVAGIVFVDPNSSKYPEQCRQAGLSFCEPPSDVPFWASWFLPKAVTGEIKGFATTHKQINDKGALPNVPLAVISALGTRTTETKEQKQAAELYLKMHKQLAASVPLSKHIVCQKCKHDIHIEEPQLVTQAIEWVVKQYE